MMKTTILIADDHSILRMGLKAMLNVRKDMTVVGEAANGKQAVDLAKKLKPDVVVMDLIMPELNGAEATKQILDILPDTKIIILTSFGDSTDLLRAIQNGCVGIQLKENDKSLLLDAIRKVIKGKICIPEELLAQMKDQKELAVLTKKQSEILHSVSRGLTNNDIAGLFGITEVGVKKHLRRIFDKIGAANRSEAITIALKKHLLKI